MDAVLFKAYTSLDETENSLEENTISHIMELFIMQIKRVFTDGNMITYYIEKILIVEKMKKEMI